MISDCTIQPYVMRCVITTESPQSFLLLYVQGSKEFMGRCAVPLSQFIKEEGLEEEIWLPLGKGDWTNLEGPVS